jgi:phosphoribosyl 1,2-cyclic phosphate phosphodiesterase
MTGVAGSTHGMRFVILGCGSSGGVPRIAGGWGACDPAEARNRRRRCSALVERRGPDGVTRVLIDTSPDLREQLLDAGVEALDAVVYTHEHADHTHGIDDLRAITIATGRLVDAYLDAKTSALLRERFGYCFITPEGSDYPPILVDRRIEPGGAFTVHGQGGPIRFMPLRLVHGSIDALGFRIGGLAYTPDLNAIPDESVPFLEGLDTWVIDALRPRPHPSHFSLQEALEWVRRLKPRRAVLTNLHVDLDYRWLERTLPEGVRPAHDGLELMIEEAP